MAEKYGADTITDLSMGGPIVEIRRKIAENTNTPLTTVPIYQTVINAGSFKTITEYDLVQMIRKHVGEGFRPSSSMPASLLRCWRGSGASRE